jgi:hypothetical protein
MANTALLNHVNDIAKFTAASCIFLCVTFSTTKTESSNMICNQLLIESFRKKICMLFGQIEY